MILDALLRYGCFDADMPVVHKEFIPSVVVVRQIFIGMRSKVFSLILLKNKKKKTAECKLGKKVEKEKGLQD